LRNNGTAISAEIDLVAHGARGGDVVAQFRQDELSDREQVGLSVDEVLGREAEHAGSPVAPQQRLVVCDAVAQMVQPAYRMVDCGPAGTCRERGVRVRDPQRVVVCRGGQVAPEPEHQLGK
jgi:hypothetical protein